jgi:hypothetical protein
MRVVLISCSKLKRKEKSPARDLYISPLFKQSRRYAEIYGDRWAILSAKHGLVLPDKMIEPYNVALGAYSGNALSKEERRAWAEKTQRQIVTEFGRDAEFIVLAGKEYVAALKGLPNVKAPLAGLQLGPRLAWLRDALRGT